MGVEDCKLVDATGGDSRRTPRSAKTTANDIKRGCICRIYRILSLGFIVVCHRILVLLGFIYFRILLAP